jgi:hypothetical protein
MRRLNHVLALAPLRLGQYLGEDPGWPRTILFFAWTSFLLVIFGCATTGPGSIQAASPSQSTVTYAPSAILAKAAVSGTVQQLDFFDSIHPDCTSAGYPTIHVVTPPGHGTLSFEQGTEYPNFPKDNQRYGCNKQRLPATLVFYQSNPGYAGPDVAIIETIFPTGFLRTTTYILTVK